MHTQLAFFMALIIVVTVIMMGTDLEMVKQQRDSRYDRLRVQQA